MESASFARDPFHLYSISDPHGRSFSTGLTADGTQAILGILYPEIVCILFRLDGSLIEVERRPFWDHNSSDIVPRGLDKQEMSNWQDELGWKPAQIRVKKFIIPELDVGIEDIPGHYLDVLQSPSGLNAEEAALLQRAEQWIRAGNFVFHWGTDYWLDEGGTVIAS